MRLIDADNMKTIHEIQMANFNSIEGIQEWIDQQPTAFDIQKVCQQLFQESEDVRGDSMIELYAAQEIVERRGIE